MKIRRAVADDVSALRNLYAEVVLAVGPKAYEPDQVHAWAVFAREPAFDEFVTAVNTYVAVEADVIVGFCGIDDDGHIASIYVSSTCLRRGIGKTLLDFALAQHPTPTAGRYFAETSAFSLPLFERCGFARVGAEQVIRSGVMFERFLVERAVDG